MPFDIMSGFNVGQQIGGGQTGLGAFVDELNSRAQKIMDLRAQAQAQIQTAAPLAEQETVGRLRAYTSPEAEQLRSRMGMGGFPTRTPSVGNAPQGFGTSSQPSGVGTTSGNPGAFQAEYGVTGERIDPISGLPTMEVGQTPESKMQQAIATQRGESMATQKVSAGAAVNALKNVVANFKAMRGQTGYSGRVAGAQNTLEGAIGTNPHVAGFNASLTDAAVAIGRISAPNARIGPDFINAFKSTLGNLGMTDQELYSKINANVRQIAGRIAAEAGQPLNDQLIQQVTDNIISTAPASIPGSNFPPGQQGQSQASLHPDVQQKGFRLK